ncbi:nucleotidyltransferase domain-containing protein [Propionivibrio sp.]|uniref:nucleotidyltransferase domain-containing protein n=1 Tax=Propionivibrio sp. TaxID=2212460 RepID=UPI003BF14317
MNKPWADSAIPHPVTIAVERILAVASPNRIILFGSQARGDTDADSDIDLMVIESRVGNPALEAARLYRAVGWVGKGVDILVYSENEFARRSTVPGTVLHQALTQGKVVYDRGPH